MNSGVSTLVPGDALRSVDSCLIRLFGLGYLRLTRDVLIHERLRYLVWILATLGRRGIRVLDVGCGSGMALYYLDRFGGGIAGDYVGLDMNIERLPERWRFVYLPHTFRPVNLDEEWDFGRFDVVWCSEVIEHLLDDERLFRRLSAHLGPLGVLVITTPSRSFVERMGRFLSGFDYVSSTQAGGHVRAGYDLEDFRRLATLCSLSLVSHAWISPCTADDLRARERRATPFGLVRIRLGDLRRPRSPFVVDGEPGTYAGGYYSLAVTFRRAMDEQIAAPEPMRFASL